MLEHLLSESPGGEWIAETSKVLEDARTLRDRLD